MLLIARVTKNVSLVRHAMPVFTHDQAPDQWELNPEGHFAAVALAPELPAGAYLVASEERKAWQTLAPAGEPRRDPRFGEVIRVGEPWEGNFRELRRSYVDGVDHAGWEPRAQVAARFDAAIEEHLALAEALPLVVASHGMAMTVWLTARAGLTHPGEFWAALRFPELLRVDLSAKTVTTIWP
jgi:2,3-bisphosphoglycerate-dependent phosphoglycerate mutase